METEGALLCTFLGGDCVHRACSPFCGPQRQAK